MEYKTKLGKIALDQITVVKDFNKRYDYGDIEGLAKSIREHGLKMPVSVAINGLRNSAGQPMYDLIDGHRRIQAIEIVCQLNGGTFTFPAIVYPIDYPLEDRLMLQMATGVHQSTLNMLEQARIITELQRINPDLSADRIAPKIGKSINYVYDCLLLINKGTPSIMTAIADGRMTPKMAVALIKAYNETTTDIVDKVLAEADQKGIKEVILRDVLKLTGDAKLPERPGKRVEKALKGTQTDPFAVSNPEFKTDSRFDNERWKNDPTVKKVEALLEALHAQMDKKKIRGSFGVLEAVLKYLQGKMTSLEVAPLFFVADEKTGGKVKEGESRVTHKRTETMLRGATHPGSEMFPQPDMPNAE